MDSRLSMSGIVSSIVRLGRNSALSRMSLRLVPARTTTFAGILGLGIGSEEKSVEDAAAYTCDYIVLRFSLCKVLTSPATTPA